MKTKQMTDLFRYSYKSRIFEPFCFRFMHFSQSTLKDLAVSNRENENQNILSAQWCTKYFKKKKKILKFLQIISNNRSMMKHKNP